MRLGLIARCDSSGLGTQCWEYYRNLAPTKTLVIDVGHLHNTTSHCNKRSYLDRFPGATVFRGWNPHSQFLVQFLRGLDVVLSAETWYSEQLVPLARSLGVRTVLVPNYEFLPPVMNTPDLLAVPSMWHFDDFPDPKTQLPVPIALDRFEGVTRPLGGGPRHFLHIVGRPAVHDRNGTGDLLMSLRHTRTPMRLTIRCQDRLHLERLRREHPIPRNVEIDWVAGDVRDYWENYTHGDVLVMPRRYGGLCLPVNEALGAGMPVIMTDISPNNSWLPPEWLVSSRHLYSFMAQRRVDVHAAEPAALAAKLDEFADPDFHTAARCQADRLATQLSWDKLKPDYLRALS